MSSTIRTISLSDNEAARAGEMLRRGGLVVFPTETVYGLGANAFDAAACRRIFAAKGRPPDNPLIVHLTELGELRWAAREVPPLALLLLERFSPGPFTVILPRSQRLPAVVTAGLDTVALRIPSSPIARAVIRASGVPIAAPSANRSGRPSPTDYQSAVEQMWGRVEAVMRGPACEVGLESTIVRICGAGAEVEVLREGAVTREMLAAAVRGRGELLDPDETVTGEAAAAAHAEPTTAASAPAIGPAIAPGMRHRHYQPDAAVITAEPADLPRVLQTHDRNQTAALMLAASAPGSGSGGFRIEMRFQTVEEYARELYRAFRQADRSGCSTIIAELPPPGGIGRALRDRLLRAATAETQQGR